MCGIFAVVKSSSVELLNLENVKNDLVKIQHNNTLASNVLDGLEKLEYRGYDSCGICVVDNSGFATEKVVGSVSNLRAKAEHLNGKMAISHTRWATHGEVTECNTHPHVFRNVAIVHNGVVSNHSQIREYLLNIGYEEANTNSDSLCISILLSHFISDLGFSFQESILCVRSILEGASAVVAIFLEDQIKSDSKNNFDNSEISANLQSEKMHLSEISQGKNSHMALFTQDVPLVICKNETTGDIFISSDLEAVDEATYVYYPQNDDIFFASNSFSHYFKVESVKNFNVENNLAKEQNQNSTNDSLNTKENEMIDIQNIVRNLHMLEKFQKIDQDLLATRFHPEFKKCLNNTKKCVNSTKYKHKMLEEIHSQSVLLPILAQNCVAKASISNEKDSLDRSNFVELLNIKQKIITNSVNRIIFIACGSSYNACLTIMPFFARKYDTNVYIASEFLSTINPSNFHRQSTIVIFVSQSGETMDVILALKKFHDSGIATISITNNENSTIARLTDYNLLCLQNAENAVAATKSFTAQILLLFYLSNICSQEEVSVNTIGVENALHKAPEISLIAKDIAKFENILCIGRSIAFGLASEIALKIKEISYVHAESIPAGELKHGHIALISDKTITIAIITDSFDVKSISSTEEILTRGGKVLLICPISIAKDLENRYDKNILTIIPVSIATHMINVILEIATISQLCAYYIADELNQNIDRPRNLAKSVTVE